MGISTISGMRKCIDTKSTVHSGDGTESQVSVPIGADSSMWV